MKLRNYFFGALACLALASCSSDDDAVDSGQKDGVACIAVKLVMPGGNITRAEDIKWNGEDGNGSSYEVGTGAETFVKNAYFYLFDGETKIQATSDHVDNPELEAGSTNTIEQYFKEAHIVLVDAKTPTHIIAVLNVNETLKTALAATTTLTEFKAVVGDAALSTCSNAEGLVMSNSVYVDGDDVVYATPVAGKIGYGSSEETAKDEAKKNPVTIAVERVFARVNVSEKTGGIQAADISNNKLSDGTTVITPTIVGWWLDNTNKKSNLIKQLEAEYTFTKVGTESRETGWWNDASDFRSYWANSYKPTTDGDYGHYTWGSANTVDKYCFENTYNNVSENDKYSTQIVVAAVLKDGSGNVVNLVRWAGQDFLTPNEFYTEVLKSLVDFKKSTDGGSSRVALTSSDLEILYNIKEKTLSYNVGGVDTKLKDWQSLLNFKAVAGTTYYDANGNEISGQNIINAVRNKIGLIRYYNQGQTYYFTKIEHEPYYQETDHAIIRNHIYRLTLNSITGLGTPVPNPKDPDGTDPIDPYYPDPTDPNGPDPDPDPSNPDPDQPITPELPEGDHSAISATVNILKYRVVTQSVDLGK